jgi:hypothetical protein
VVSEPKASRSIGPGDFPLRSRAASHNVFIDQIKSRCLATDAASAKIKAISVFFIDQQPAVLRHHAVLSRSKLWLARSDMTSTKFSQRSVKVAEIDCYFRSIRVQVRACLFELAIAGCGWLCCYGGKAAMWRKLLF